MASNAIDTHELSRPREEVDLKEFYQSKSFDEQSFYIISSKDLSSKALLNDWYTRLKRGSTPTTANKPSRPHVGEDIIWNTCNRFNYTIDYPKDSLPNDISLSIDNEDTLVEYDMDEQDIIWLGNLNHERRSKGQKTLSLDNFEYLMDRFERSWFTLSKAAQRWTSRRFESKSAEDLRCDICFDGETSLNNMIVICENCDVAVHQECYGVPLIPEGPWLCKKCYLGISDVKCCLCPWNYGALKQSNDSDLGWCHLLCAIFLNQEISILNSAYKEPIELSNIHRDRWNLQCQYCRIKTGAPVQCTVKTCHVAMHPRCARHVGCDLDLESNTIKCLKHTEDIGFNNLSKNVPLVTLQDFSAKARSKDSLGYAKYYQHPVTSKHTLDLLLSSKMFSNWGEKQRICLIESVARYWSLKRGQRCGSALIKSLQPEPWSSGGVLNDVELSLKQRKRLLLKLLFLEQIALLIQRREKLKFGSLLTSLEILDIIADPIRNVLTALLNSLRSADRNKIFYEPVDVALVPDYYDIVKQPMSLSLIEENIKSDKYKNLQEFHYDVERIHLNAILYNKEGTYYHQAAMDFASESKVLFEKIEKKINSKSFNNLWKQSLIDLKWVLPIDEASRIGSNWSRMAKSESKPINSGSRKSTVNSQKSKTGLGNIVLVWAKVRGFPFYPARIIPMKNGEKQDLSNVPEEIMKLAKKKRTSIVQFFDKKRAWATVPVENLVPLTEDFKFDFDTISQISPGIKNMGRKIIDDLRRAHEECLSFRNKG